MRRTSTLLALLNAFCITLSAQNIHIFSGGVDTAWVRLYGAGLYNFGRSAEHGTSFDVDAAGNVYVAGSSYCLGTGDDFATVKYDSCGEVRWVNRYTGRNIPEAIDDCPSSLVVDSRGNIYVAGFVDAEHTLGGYDGGHIAVIKYNQLGEIVWASKNDCSGQTASLAVDSCGNVYVTGKYGFSTSDYCTIKYNAYGDTLWVRMYDGPGKSFDRGSAVAVAADGNVYVTGTSSGSGGSSDYATIKYSSSGERLWVSRYNGTSNGFSLFASLAVDSIGNAYVTGSNWGSDSTFDYATIKYTPSGDTAWVRRYSGSVRGDDRAMDLEIDADGNVYVTGWSRGLGTAYDYVTIKYTSSGDTVWVRRYNGPENSDDAALGLAVDVIGNVYVTGRSDAYIATIKYDAAGNLQWVARFACEWGSTSMGVRLDRQNNVYIAGTSNVGYQSFFNVVKYVQTLTVAVQQMLNIPSTLVLNQNYPNPFNPTTNIEFQLPNESRVRLSVYDLLGREVTTLVNEQKPAGRYSVNWDASRFSSGIYFYRLSAMPLVQRDLVPTAGRNGQAGELRETKRMILLK